MVKYNNFGEAVSSHLAANGTTQTALSNSIGRSTTSLNRVMSASGGRLPNAEWCDLVANALALTDPERAKLHATAAADNGFKLDLTKKG